MKLDIGCGNGKAGVDYLGIDNNPAAHPDLLMDILEFPWPWNDNSVTDIYCSHFIEHIPMTCWCCRNERDPLIRFFEECWRVLIPQGALRIRWPLATSEGAFQDPTHRRFITRNMAGYLNKPWRVSKGVQQYDIRCDFDIVEDKVLMDEDVKARETDFQKYAFYHFNVVYEALMTLNAVKPCR